MGFDDKNTVLKVLAQTNGNIEDALDILEVGQE